MFELLQKITDAQDIETVWALHCDAMADYGFDRLLYGFTRFRSGTHVGSKEDMLLLTNHPTEYAEAILANSRFVRGPMAKWAFDHSGARSWSYMQDLKFANTLSKDERDMMAFNESMGVNAGYTISFPSYSDRFKGAAALVGKSGLNQSDVDAIWEKDGEEIFLINKIVHLKCTTLPREAGKPLTRRQQEVLDWVGDGKSTADVAMILGLTPATVEKHLRLARETLNAETTAQAILKRSFQNQVFIVD